MVKEAVCRETQTHFKQLIFFFWFGGILGSASRAEFPVSLSNLVGFTPRLLYISTHHSSESFIPLKTGWAQDAWLQWSLENWYFHLDISRWQTIDIDEHIFGDYKLSWHLTANLARKRPLDKRGIEAKPLSSPVLIASLSIWPLFTLLLTQFGFM